MILEKISYIDFKNFVETRELFPQCLSNGYARLLFATDGTFSVSTRVIEGTPDYVDFQENIESNCNKRLGHRVSHSPFSLKTIDNGKSLFKRVHGVESTIIQPGATGYLTFIIPYEFCKFSGAALIGCDVGDSLDFFVLDTPTNSISGLDVETYGPNAPINQFGFDVRTTKDFYENTSNYDADLFKDMQIYCAYKNNSAQAKKVYMNSELHEVK